MKYLVTHKWPHLDDIAAIWLWRRFVPGWSKAKDGYVVLNGGGAAVTWKNKPVDSDPSVVHIGVGRGKFDEHKGDIGKSATLLVHEFLTKKKYIPKSDQAGIAKLVDFVNLVDTGRLTTLPHGPMYIPMVLRDIDPSEKRTAIGCELLNASIKLYANEALVEKDWQKHEEFQTRWGKVAALTTAADGAEWFGYSQGCVLVIHHDPKRNWRMFRAAADSSVDLTKVYEELKRVDPKGAWFLHHSKHMLMNGSRSAPDVVRSKLSLSRLVEIVKQVAG